MATPDYTPDVTFPPAPWHSRGGFWIGGFRSERPAVRAHGLTPIAPQVLIVALIRYLEGTLRYDELIVGSVAWRATRLGLHVHYMWVNDEQSLWGGRRIWGLPKQLATFEWHGSHVAIADQHGLIAALNVDQPTAWLPRLPLIAPFWGLRDGDLIHTLAPVSARLAYARMRLDQWSDRFAWRIGPRPFVSLAGKAFRMTVPAPAYVTHRGSI